MVHTHRILGLHSGALGDVILFAQLLSALRLTGQRVALAAGGEKARLLESLGVIDEAIEFEGLGLEAIFSTQPEASRLRRLADRLGHCDRLLSCFAVEQPAQQRLVDLCGAAAADFLPIRPESGDQTHLLDAWARRLALPGMPLPAWAVPKTLKERNLRNKNAELSARFVALHVGSGSPAKCWPIQSYLALAQRLDLPVVFLLGPVESERIGNQLLRRLADAGTVLNDLTLQELASVLAAAAAYVGNDTGPTHLAAALGCPTVAIFGPTKPAHFAPRGRQVRCLRRQPLGGLAADEVAAILQRMISPGRCGRSTAAE